MRLTGRIFLAGWCAIAAGTGPAFAVTGDESRELLRKQLDEVAQLVTTYTGSGVTNKEIGPRVANELKDKVALLDVVDARDMAAMLEDVLKWGRKTGGVTSAAQYDQGKTLHLSLGKYDKSQAIGNPTLRLWLNPIRQDPGWSTVPTCLEVGMGQGAFDEKKGEGYHVLKYQAPTARYRGATVSRRGTLGSKVPPGWAAQHHGSRGKTPGE